MTRVMVLLGVWYVSVFCQPVIAGEPVTPLYQARLEATLAEWEGRVRSVDPEIEDPTWWPASLNPVSYCLGSACSQSYCIGSVCINSGCVGSGCVGSTCVGSGCVASICLGSGCAGSICGGSACWGPTGCPKKCGGYNNPPITNDPDNGGATFSLLACP